MTLVPAMGSLRRLPIAVESSPFAMQAGKNQLPLARSPSLRLADRTAFWPHAVSVPTSVPRAKCASGDRPAGRFSAASRQCRTVRLRGFPDHSGIRRTPPPSTLVLIAHRMRNNPDPDTGWTEEQTSKRPTHAVRNGKSQTYRDLG
jgi:hypothetical protein